MTTCAWQRFQNVCVNKNPFGCWHVLGRVRKVKNISLHLTRWPALHRQDVQKNCPCCICDRRARQRKSHSSYLALANWVFAPANLPHDLETARARHVQVVEDVIKAGDHPVAHNGQHQQPKLWGAWCSMGHVCVCVCVGDGLEGAEVEEGAWLCCRAHGQEVWLNGPVPEHTHAGQHMGNPPEAQARFHLEVIEAVELACSCCHLPQAERDDRAAWPHRPVVGRLAAVHDEPVPDAPACGLCNCRALQ